MSSGTGLLTVEMHDHPAAQIAECWVTIDGIQVRHESGEWMPLAGDYPDHFDLFELQDGKTRVLGEQAVDAGDYDRIRVHMTDARLVMAGGTTVDVPLPAGGLQFDVPMMRRCEVIAGSGMHVSLDFRISTSFQHNADETWTCDPDVVVDGVWEHGGAGHHG